MNHRLELINTQKQIWRLDRIQIDIFTYQGIWGITDTVTEPISTDMLYFVAISQGFDRKQHRGISLCPEYEVACINRHLDQV